MKLNQKDIAKFLGNDEDKTLVSQNKLVEKRAKVSHSFDDGTRTKGQDTKKRFKK